MCLSRKFSENKKNKIVQKLKDTIEVYKIVMVDKEHKKYLPLFYAYLFGPYKEGSNHLATSNFIDDEAGFYTFKSRIGAWLYMHSGGMPESKDGHKIIKCKIKKKDILMIGKTEFFRTYITSNIEIPKFEVVE